MQITQAGHSERGLHLFHICIQCRGLLEAGAFLQIAGGFIDPESKSRWIRMVIFRAQVEEMI